MRNPNLTEEQAEVQGIKLLSSRTIAVILIFLAKQNFPKNGSDETRVDQYILKNLEEGRSIRDIINDIFAGVLSEKSFDLNWYNSEYWNKLITPEFRSLVLNWIKDPNVIDDSSKEALFSTEYCLEKSPEVETIRLSAWQALKGGFVIGWDIGKNLFK